MLLRSSAAPSVVAAASKAIEEDLPRLAAALEARVQLATTFCETLGAECEGVVGDVLEAFDAAAGEGGALLKATRDSVARDARRALERTVLPAQLELLRAKAFGELKKKLKGLRIQRGVRQDAQKMVSQSVAFFDQKAKAALAKTAWSARAQKRDLERFLSDYVQERLDAAVLGGTHIPGGRQGLRKLWPFPVALSFHWLQPAALGRAVDGAQGLTASDLKRFNVKAEDVGKPAFAIPGPAEEPRRGAAVVERGARRVEVLVGLSTFLVVASTAGAVDKTPSAERPRICEIGSFMLYAPAFGEKKRPSPTELFFESICERPFQPVEILPPASAR